VIHDVPLLVESKRGFEYAAVIVVEAPLEVRLDRLESRGVPRDDARRRIELQASDEDRRKVATWIVDNAGDFEALDRQIEKIWAELEKMVSEKAAADAADADAASGAVGETSSPESRA
jgi:dephospho-CoA kinase